MFTNLSPHKLWRSTIGVTRHFTASSSALTPRIVVVGGGTAGCAVSSALKKATACEITLVDPADEHHNQPMWTLVGGGIKQAKETRQPMADTLPDKVKWLKEAAVAFKPEENMVVTSKRHLPYDYLVVACGLSINFEDIKGLPEALKTPIVSSNYSPELCSKTWECLQKLQKGDAIFTYPAGPVKCGGAGQKIAYLAEDYWRSNHRRDGITVSYNTALPRVFGNAHYAEPLEAMCAARNIRLGFGLDLVEVLPKQQKAKFSQSTAVTRTDSYVSRSVNGDRKGEEVDVHYDFLHVVPKQAAPDFLQKSPLADKSGFVDVDKETLQHVKYNNVYAVGDCSNLPTSKTAAAISGQLQVLVPNLLSNIQGTVSEAKYNGYTSCPITTNYGKVMMCEFDYDGNPMESFPFIDQRKESKLMWFVKTKLIPIAYWRFLVNGASPWRKIPAAISNFGKA